MADTGRVLDFPPTVPKPRVGVITSVDRSLMTLRAFPRYNPDQLVGRKGLGVYAKMRVDEQVKAVTQFRRDAIISRGWQFVFEQGTSLSEDEQAERVSTFTTLAKRIRGGFNEVLRGVARGSDDGFSMLEKVYADIEIEDQFSKRTMTGLSDLIYRDPSSFRFYTDDYGELVRFTQVVNSKEIELDHDKFVHYVEDPIEDPYFGLSQLNAAYRSWYMKDVLLKLQALTAEKYGGFLLLSQDVGAPAITPNSPEHTAIEAMLRDVKALSGVLLPQGITASLEFPPAGADPFKDKIEYHDLAIAKSVLVPNLLGLSHTGQTGAFAQSQTQLEAFYWTLMTTGAAYTQCLNEQLFYPLGEVNYGDGQYPYLCFKPFSMEHVKWVLETVVKLVSGSALIMSEKDEAWLRKLLEMPERAPADKPLVTPQDQAAIDQGQQTIDQNAKLGQAKIDAQTAANDANAARAKANYATEQLEEVRGVLGALSAAATKSSVVVHTAARTPASASREHSHDDPSVSGVVYSVSKAAERVAFAVIEQRTDQLIADTGKRFGSALAAMVNKLLNSEAVTSGRFAELSNVELGSGDIGRIKGVFKDAVGQAFHLGTNQARSEINRARGTDDLSQAKFAAVRQQAADFLEAKGFRMAQDATDATRKIIQLALENAIKFGYSVQQTREAIWAGLAGKGYVSVDDIGEFSPTEMEAVAKALGIETVTDRAQRAYVDTLVKTNVFDAMNEARFNEFTDPALADFILALRYSAVLDDRTTEICTALNGDTWRVDNELWDSYRPPNHFNCRSVLVPVTAVDEWDGEESPPPDVQPQDGFGG